MPKALIMGGLYQPLVTSDLLDTHIWYSNDFPWSQDVKFEYIFDKNMPLQKFN